jgi:hypothetical protein
MSRISASLLVSQARCLFRLEGMLKWLLRKRLAAFATQFGYDVSCMRHVLDTDMGAFLTFARASSISRYRKDAPLDLHYAVKLTGAADADCGPCTQLVVTMALRDGVPGATIARILRGDEAEMTEPTRLGVRYARAVLARDATADDLRAEIERRHGPRAVLSVGFALVASQMFPTLKYALGYGHACTRIDVEGHTITPKLGATKPTTSTLASA